jgi:hypothetical protein
MTNPLEDEVKGIEIIGRMEADMGNLVLELEDLIPEDKNELFIALVDITQSCKNGYISKKDAQERISEFLILCRPVYNLPSLVRFVEGEYSRITMALAKEKTYFEA